MVTLSLDVFCIISDRKSRLFHRSKIIDGEKRIFSTELFVENVWKT